MKVVEHKWKDRWRAKLDKEFVCTVDKISLSYNDSMAYRVSCELYPGSQDIHAAIFRKVVELSATSLRISINTNSLQDEITRQIEYAKSELKKLILSTLFSGYSTLYDYENKKWEFIPIQEDWKVSA